MTTYALYGRRGSGSLAVQVALEEIGLPYDRIWVGTEAAELAAFRKISPTGKVPALVLPDKTLMFESAAMLIHLSLAHPEAGLAPPAGTGRHARFLQWMVFMSANLYEAALRIYYPDRYTSRGAADAAAICEQGTSDYLDHLGLVSRSLAPYVLGDEYSIADIYLYMLAAWFPGGKAQVYARLPALGLQAQTVSSRPALVKVEADHAA